MRFLFKTLAFLLVVGTVAAAALLAWGHVQIRRVDPALPTIDEVVEADGSAQLPVRLSWINTASQKMPRAGVLEPDLDPEPNAAYTMSHPSFVLEWQDGRVFLIDMGMNAAGAVEFGAMGELVGADPIEPHVNASSELGDARKRIAGIGFTHMHADHTGGVLDLCRDLGVQGLAEPIPVFQHTLQMASGNHTTHPGKQHLLEADCIEPRGLGNPAGLVPIPGFPGLFAIPAGGHTPGSTIYVAQLRTIPGESDGRRNDVETWVITGDIVNHYAGVQHDIPKPSLYSLLIVPEFNERLATLRTFLKHLADEPGVNLLVNHDRNQIEATNLAAY